MAVEIKNEFTRPRVATNQRRLAEDLIEKWHEGEFEFSRYKDRYRQTIKEAIAAKRKGVEIAPPEEEPEEEVINFMDALKRSVEEAGAKRKRAKRSPRKSTARRKRA